MAVEEGRAVRQFSVQQRAGTSTSERQGFLLQLSSVAPSLFPSGQFRSLLTLRVLGCREEIMTAHTE